MYNEISDYNLSGALINNGGEDIIKRYVQTLAVIEGENDGASWHWIVQLKNPDRFAYITGWCDYTGWDCQSNCSVFEGDTLASVLEEVEFETNKHELSVQIDTGKVITWREQVEKDNPDFLMPIVDLIARNRRNQKE